MKTMKTGSIFSRGMLAGTLVLALLAGGCSPSEDTSVSEPVSQPASEAVSLSESAPEAESAPEESASAPESAEEETAASADGMKHTDFTLAFGADLAEEISFSMDLPADWTTDSVSSMYTLYDENGWISQVETSPRTAAAGQPFTDLEETWPDPLSVKDMTVSGYPVKCYVIKAQGDTVIDKTQYMYYVSVEGLDSVYPFIWFSVATGTEGAEEEFDRIVSSFQLVEG